MSKHKRWFRKAKARRKKEKRKQQKLQQQNNRRSEKMYKWPGQKKEWVKPAVVQEEYWEAEIETVSECSKAPNEVVIWICPLAKVKIDALMEKYPNIEWFSYLLGRKPSKDDERTVVDDIYIPKQTVTATSVDEIDAPDFNKLPIIGALHSHHGMGNGFSGTDHAYVNGNHNISLVISKDGVAGQVRWQTPCGALKIVDAKVKPLMEVDFDKDEFLKSETKKIGKKSYTYTPPTGSQGNFVETDPHNYYGGGRVFPALNQQEQDLVNELDDIDKEPATEKVTEKTEEKAEEKTEKPEEWINEDQSLTDALTEAFGE